MPYWHSKYAYEVESLDVDSPLTPDPYLAFDIQYYYSNTYKMHVILVEYFPTPV